MKKVVIIGGGPAGLQAAVTAAERGHKVILVGKEKKLGGQVNLAAEQPENQCYQRPLSRRTNPLLVGSLVEGTSLLLLGFSYGIQHFE